MQIIRRTSKRNLFVFMLITIILSVNMKTVFAVSQNTDKAVYDLDAVDFSKIDNLVNKILRKSDTKGASVVIVSEDKTIYRSYGYADSNNGMKVDKNTLFELGSNSKAFTGLAIFYLEEKGLLSLNDPVKKYIPWFNVRYKGYYNGRYIDSDVELTIQNLLYHTSGIPFKAIGDIPEGESNDMLEKTVRMLKDIQLDYYPGSKFSYATINYDVLGLIIQNISGMAYEEFIESNILKPLGLYDTYLFHSYASETGRMSKGYKILFFSSKEYNAPVYRGNTPAGYFISSAVDMEKWLKIQMEIVEVPEFYKKIIQKTHLGNTTVASSGDYYYGGGWLVHLRGDYIKHGGNNPNFSSMIIIKPRENFGICVLCNLNSNAADYLASNILNIIEGKKIDKYETDGYKKLDIIFSIITIGAIVFGILFFVLSIVALVEIITGRRNRVKLTGVKVAGIMFAVPIMIFFGFCVYYLPNILFYRLQWKAVMVWGSSFIALGSICGFAAGIAFMLYLLITFNFPKDHEKGYLVLVPLSLINGFMSALIIFTINESFNRNLEYSKELLIYFVFSLSFFVYSMKLLQGKLILITNEITYDKRMDMIKRIMNSSFQAIERIGGSRIYSGLNNDTTAISRLPEILVRLVSDILTLIFCLCFLLSKSVYAFIASVSIIVINGLISFITGMFARKYWEENRNIQDTFFGQMSDLIKGFKELVLNKLRKREFYIDIKKYARLATDLNESASIRILNFNMYNVLMYNIIFGIVVFVFPLFMENISVNELRENLFIVFYMIAPFDTVARAIPQLTQVNVNLRRIDTLIKELDEAAKSNVDDVDDEDDKNVVDHESVTCEPATRDIRIKFSDVEYTYISQDKQGEKAGEFTLGPINLEFGTGELTFITGGNGSGKSTLAKLITGLYSCQKGIITINGEKAELKDLNECFSSVFSDYHLFKKLYGIDHTGKKEKLISLLDRTGLKDKVEVNNEGEFSSIELSAGQRKRLAFIVCYLEDKPMMLFDEWAAEQDTEFKSFFYNDLLPMLKKNDKGVIVISHDDRYFDIADRLIKLECGTIVENVEKAYV